MPLPAGFTKGDGPKAARIWLPQVLATPPLPTQGYPARKPLHRHFTSKSGCAPLRGLEVIAKPRETNSSQGRFSCRH